MRIMPLSQCENSFQPDYLRDRDRPKDKVNYNIEKVKMACLSVRRRLTNEESWFCWSMVGWKINKKSQIPTSPVSSFTGHYNERSISIWCCMWVNKEIQWVPRNAFSRWSRQPEPGKNLGSQKIHQTSQNPFQSREIAVTSSHHDPNSHHWCWRYGICTMPSLQEP